ncbi:PDZ domain-containing protein [Actinoplanes sp. NPDC051346]|uniref:YlbL family protein n=1 Tax=Actinoplanes sp. NPDC051346 TaxID=3155048 RepID=UPI003447F291
MVIAGAVVTALLGVGVQLYPLPYVVLEPGPTVDTLGRYGGKQVITVTGGESSASAGQLRMTTVQVKSDVGLAEAVEAWFDGDRALAPRSLVYPIGQTTEQVDRENTELFASSQSSAEIVALRELGYPLRPQVTAVTAGGPSADALRVGDVITGVGTQGVDTAETFADLAGRVAAGTQLTIAYTRAGRAGSATVTSAGGTEGIGVRVEQKQQTPFSVAIEVDEIGGPSAGLMFTLGIIDKLTPADLTGGRIIAGTGTIDDAGAVGPIGGIPQKLDGAKAAGAQLFLVPEGNCDEALRNAVPGLAMAKVATVGEALTAMRTFVAGGNPTPCAPAR